MTFTELKLAEIFNPNKQPIGNYNFASDFDVKKYNYQKGDSFYLFSDGFADQFGGEFGKKFKTKQLMKLISSVQNKSMKDQYATIVSVFDDWKKNYEQLDDICFMGFQL